METDVVLNLLVAAVVAISTIYQASVSHKLQQQVHRINTSLDQSIQRLHLAREAVNKMIVAILYFEISKYTVGALDEGYQMKQAERLAAEAELRGIAIAIGDKELLDIVNKRIEFSGRDGTSSDLQYDQAQIMGKAQTLHTRISQLLVESAKGTSLTKYP